MINGTGNLPGLVEMDKVKIIGGVDNPAREGLVSLVVDGLNSADVVKKLNEQGIRTHLRKADHYSGNILDPLGWMAVYGCPCVTTIVNMRLLSFSSHENNRCLIHQMVFNGF